MARIQKVSVCNAPERRWNFRRIEDDHEGHIAHPEVYRAIEHLVVHCLEESP